MTLQTLSLIALVATILGYFLANVIPPRLSAAGGLVVLFGSIATAALLNCPYFFIAGLPAAGFLCGAMIVNSV